MTDQEIRELIEVCIDSLHRQKHKYLTLADGVYSPYPTFRVYYTPFVVFPTIRKTIDISLNELAVRSTEDKEFLGQHIIRRLCRNIRDYENNELLVASQVVKPPAPNKRSVMVSRDEYRIMATNNLLDPDVNYYIDD